jgi:hypothetical protein
MVRKMSMGDGVAYHKQVKKNRTVRVDLTPRQALVLRKGGAVTIKAITDTGSHELTLPEPDLKKLLTKLYKGKGGRISLNGGSVESVFRDLGKYVQPVADAGMDRAIREIGRGRKRRGKGMFDFLDPAKNGVNKFFNDEVAPVVIDQGIPTLTGALGGLAGSALTGGPIGGVAGSYIGKKAGEEAVKRIRRKRGKGVYRMMGEGIMPANVGSGIMPAGVNLRKGSGMNEAPIQLGTPYISTSSPAFNPVQLPNQFVSNNYVMRQAKAGGMIVKMR